MGQGPFGRRNLSRLGHARTRYRGQVSRTENRNDPLLWRRFPFRAGGGQFGKDGLHQRLLDGRRHPRLAREGPAACEGITRNWRAGGESPPCPRPCPRGAIAPRSLISRLTVASPPGVCYSGGLQWI